MWSFRDHHLLILEFLKSLILLLWMVVNTIGTSVCFVLFGDWREVRNGKFKKCARVGVGVDIGAVFWGINHRFCLCFPLHGSTWHLA